MKIAEALALRASVQKNLGWIKDQFKNNARVTAGRRPVEEPDELLQRMDIEARHLERLLTRINRTNLAVRDSQGVTLTELLARRDALRARQSIVVEAYQQGSSGDGYLRNDAETVPALDMRALRERVGEVNTAVREINLRIQQLNWQADLLAD